VENRGLFDKEIRHSDEMTDEVCGGSVIISYFMLL